MECKGGPDRPGITPLRLEHRRLTAGNWSVDASPGLGGAADLVLAVGTEEAFATPQVFRDLRRAYPHARLVTCSRPSSTDDAEELAAVALSFERCQVSVARVAAGSVCGADAGRALGLAVAHAELRHVFVFLDRTESDCASVASGLAASLPPGVSVVGGALSGRVGLDEPPDGTTAVAIGLRGARLALDLVLDTGEGRQLGSGPPPAGRSGTAGTRFAMLLGGTGEGRATLIQLSRDALGARAPLIDVPVRQTLGRIQGMALPLAFARGLALAAVGEAMGTLEG